MGRFRTLALALVLVLALVGVGMVGGAAWAQPAPLRQGQWQDQHGKRLQAASLRDRVVLLHFIYTQCSSTCGPQVRELALLRAALAPDVRQRVQMVSLSLDAYDTPAVLQGFARRLGADQPGWRFVSGSPDDIARVASALQAFDGRKPKPQLDDHRTALFVYDTQGQLVQRFSGWPMDRTRLQRELTALALPTTPATDLRH